MEQAIWNSAKGYSKPNEVVSIVARQGRMVQIESAPDENEGSEPFYYWVSPDELTPAQS
jgi:hypothetical protein